MWLGLRGPPDRLGLQEQGLRVPLEWLGILEPRVSQGRPGQGLRVHLGFQVQLVWLV